MPKTVAPCPALHIRLIRSLHNFLQDRGTVIVGPALQAPPVSRRLPYATALAGVVTNIAANIVTIAT